METLPPHLDNIQDKPVRILERCVTTGCPNNGLYKVLLKYIKRPAYLCEQCIIEFRRLDFIALEYDSLEKGETQSD